MYEQTWEDRERKDMTSPHANTAPKAASPTRRSTVYSSPDTASRRSGPSSAAMAERTIGRSSSQMMKDTNMGDCPIGRRLNKSAFCASLASSARQLRCRPAPLGHAKAPTAYLRRERPGVMLIRRSPPGRRR
uniref:Uncharacterized protein n=1 Tax=Plectus sambesii TaxID=2011161 RepID=A0A914X6C4_9BILA